MTWTTNFTPLPPLLDAGVLLAESTSAVELNWLTPVLADPFSREVGDSWGSPDVGPAYVNAGLTTGRSVEAGIGRIAVAVSPGTIGVMADVNVQDVRLLGRVKLNQTPIGNIVDAMIEGRYVDGSNLYRFIIRYNTNGTASLFIFVFAVGVPTVLSSTVLTAVASPAAGKWLRFRLEAVGTNPTTLRGRVWEDGAAEPAAWQAEAEDSLAATQVAADVRFLGGTASNLTSLPMIWEWDDLNVVDLAKPGGTEPSARFESYRIYRTANGVRELAGELAAKGDPFFVDWAAPTGVPLAYEIVQWDGWQESAPLLLDTQLFEAPRPFLVVAGDADHAVPLYLLPDWTRQDEAQMSARFPLGRKMPLVISGPTIAPAGQFTVWVPDEAAAQIIRDIAGLSRSRDGVVYKTDTGLALKVKLGTASERHRDGYVEMAIPYLTVR